MSFSTGGRFIPSCYRLFDDGGGGKGGGRRRRRGGSGDSYEMIVRFLFHVSMPFI